MDNVTITLPDTEEVRDIALARLRSEFEASQANARAQLAKLAAETLKLETEAAGQREAISILRLDAERAELHTQEARLAHAREFARDRYNHTFRFTTGVSEKSVESAIDELTVWHRLDPGCDVELVINSPGGDVIAGMDLFDFIAELKRAGHNFTVAARGYAASMGGILLQAGLPTEEAPRSKRVMGREAYVLIHEASTLTIGKTYEIEDEVAFMKKMQARILGIFEVGSRYAFDHGTSEIALTADQFENGDKRIPGVLGWSRRDWWLNSDECLRFGIVDEVR